MDDSKKPPIFNTHIGKYSVSYYNRGEFLSIKNEIFTEKCYQLQNELTIDNPIIIDIGSHIGLSVIFFKDKYPEAQIFAYEPISSLYDLLEYNVYSNNLRNITMVNSCVGTHNGTIPMNLSTQEDFWLSNSSIFSKSWSGRVKTEVVNVDVIDIVEVLNPHDYIDILKIDVEGFELNLLERIEMFKVKNLLIEYHPINKSRLKKIKKLLEESGFKLRYHYKGGISNYSPSGDELFVIHAKNSENIFD